MLLLETAANVTSAMLQAESPERRRLSRRSKRYIGEFVSSEQALHMGFYLDTIAMISPKTLQKMLCFLYNITFLCNTVLPFC